MRRIAKAVLSRVLVYGGILVAAWWVMFRIPGQAKTGSLEPLSEEDVRTRTEVRSDIQTLAGEIGERNIPNHAAQLEQAARFIESSFKAAGYNPQSEWYNVGAAKRRNIDAEIRGSARPQEIAVIGAHYDSVYGSPGADDNASGIAVMLALSRWFAKAKPARTLRFVAFANEEPPYFWEPEMGSLVYAQRSKQRGEQVVSMISIETVGYYSNEPKSQTYPSLLGFLYPSRGNFAAFVGNFHSRPLVHEAINSFRRATSLPTEGAALPASTPGVGWSDHWSFWQQGFPGIEITDTALYRNPYYHTVADTPDKLDYDNIARFTRGMRAIVAQISRAE